MLYLIHKIFMFSGFRQKLKIIFLVALLPVAGFVLASVIFGEFENKNIAGLENANSAVAGAVAEENPTYFYFTKDPDKTLKVSAEAYLVGDLNTGEIILVKNEDEQFPIASVSKLITAVVTDEIKKEGEIAEVSKRAVGTYGENGGLRAGEKIKVADLFYPLLLESSNEAAEVLAEHYDRESFIEKMNRQ